MAVRSVFVAVLVGLCCFGSLVGAFEREVKPNNYQNFEFHESKPEDTAVVKPESLGSFEFSETTPGVEGREYKPNNYKEFKFTEEVQGEENAHDRFAKGQYNTFDASDRFGEHQSFSAQDEVVYDARQQGSKEGATYKVGEAEYRGSDPNNRYPSSYELINAREQANEAGYKSLVSNEVRFTNVHNVKGVEAVNKAPGTVHSEAGLGGSSRFYTPASDPDFAFRFAKPESQTFGDNQFQVDNQADESMYSQFNFDNSDATNDPTATYGTTTPVLAKKEHAPVTATGHGCANMYWAEHTKQWPSFFTVNTQVTQAFGTKAGEIYGTTTLLQALYDNREDGYSQLLSHGTAALMNAYAMPNYGLRHDAVIDQFLGALSSRTTAGVQAQKFLNANHAYGPNECLN
ncbi:hypothetical protein KC19_9G110900 [Ceratodon purpureus]|uniref:Uncharacterized protein n=1 Tax=Ceratodon purpureus TaxID=3225 RepID=A0A8T0GQV8_CERPU|nr:hypothetical protein KC19_9G110900 [Ceratodon purpureus]